MVKRKKTVSRKPKVRAPKVRVPRIRASQIRPSKMKPRRPELVVGIPTLNEAETVSAVTKAIDEGLQKYFPDKKALIVNIDSNSPDNTRKAFLSTKTKTPKYCIKAPRGKGTALKLLFEYFLKTKSAEVLMLVDANVTTVSPRWVRNLITPILKGFDHCFPTYDRHEYDASITNHFCYPVLRGVLGIDVRQPIAGEMAFSRKAIDRLYNRDWPPLANRHGIDIFMALSSVFGGLRIAQAYLGERHHEEDEEKLSILFEQTAATLFELLDKHKYSWEGRVRVRRPPLFFKGDRKPKLHPAEIDYKNFHRIAVEEFSRHRADIKRIVGADTCKKLTAMFRPRGTINIGTEDWVEIVFKFVTASKVKPSKRAKALRPLFFGRFMTFYKEFLDKGHKVSEQGIVAQADLFYKSRNTLIG